MKYERSMYITGILFWLLAGIVGLSGKAAAATGGDSGSILIDTFVVVFILSFGAVSLLAGLFTMYFGAGKSRMIGVILTFVGLLVLLLSIYASMYSLVTGPIDWGHVKVVEAVVVIIGAGIGALAGVFLFLLAIMKS